MVADLELEAAALVELELTFWSLFIFQGGLVLVYIIAFSGSAFMMMIGSRIGPIFYDSTSVGRS